MAWDDDADEEWVEDEAEDSDADLLSCPSCRRSVHEDTQQCPHCGDWITPTDLSGRAQRWVWVAVVILLILSMGLFTVL